MILFCSYKQLSIESTYTRKERANELTYHRSERLRDRKKKGKRIEKAKRTHLYSRCRVAIVRKFKKSKSTTPIFIGNSLLTKEAKKEKEVHRIWYWRQSTKESEKKKEADRTFIIGEKQKKKIWSDHRKFKKKKQTYLYSRSSNRQSFKRRKSKTNTPTVGIGNKEELCSKSTVPYIARQKEGKEKTMNSLSEAVTQMSSTGQPLSTKKRWMVINKKIVFGNGIIPYTDYFGDSITSILNHLLTEDMHNMDWYLAAHINERAEKVALKLQKVGVHNYYD